MKYIGLLILILLFKSCQSNHQEGFELCNSTSTPYYYPTLGYEGDFYMIKKHFLKQYNPVNSLSNTGIVRIKFIVNCKGDVGRFHLESYDLDYKRHIIDHKITNQLLELTMELDNWIPAVNEKGEEIDSHKFFAFRLNNGIIKEILPK